MLPADALALALSRLFGHGELVRKNAEDEQKSTLFCSPNAANLFYSQRTRQRQKVMMMLQRS